MNTSSPLTGLLIEYFETGTEGVLWALMQDGKSGYEGLVLLEAGDHIEIFEIEGPKVYGGIVMPDTSIGAMQRPGSTLRQPMALGRWAHWVQSGFDADVWAGYFCSGKYRGVIHKASEST